MGGARTDEWDDRRESSEDEPDDEREDPQPADVEAFGDDGEDEETIPCPHCRAPIWEHAERCSACGEYLAADTVRIGARGLLVAGVLVAAMLAATFVFCR